MPACPMIEITCSRLCGWGLRAGWILTTFAEEVGSVALTPVAIGGLFERLVRDRIAPGRSLGHTDAP